MRARLPWRMVRFGGLTNTLIARPFRRARLQHVLASLPARPDVTVVIPVRNRSGGAIDNTLRALRRQTYPRDLVQVVLVDYNSIATHAAWLATAARTYQATVIQVANVHEWNKPHCLNVAIRRCVTRYVMILDADIVLASDYLQEAISELTRDPLQVVMNQILDLPEQARNLPPEFTDADLAGARKNAVPRTPGLHHEGTFVTTTEVLKQLRGFDENIKLWGSEDNDIIGRLENYAMTLTTLAGKTFYLHQWHPLYDGADPELIDRQFKANWAYVTRLQGKFVRNPYGWGAEAPGRIADSRG